MEGLGRYVLTLTAAALICGVLLSLFSEGTVRTLLKLCCGVFLAAAALSPLPGLTLPGDIEDARDYLAQGESLAAQGEILSRKAQSQRITQALESYILDKASRLGADIQPRIILGEDGAPDAVILRGRCSEAVKQQLGAQIAGDLGIPEEDQQWTQED